MTPILFPCTLRGEGGVKAIFYYYFLTIIIMLPCLSCFQNAMDELSTLKIWDFTVILVTSGM